MVRIKDVHLGAEDYRKKDSAYREAYRNDESVWKPIAETYLALYGSDYKGLVKRSAATAPFSEFLGALEDKLPKNPRYFASKLRWTSLEYYFASAASHFQHKRLAYEYTFYCASALTAVDALIDHCDRTDTPDVPYVFIVTTQLPNEYLSETTGGSANDDDGYGYNKARENYRELFRDKIRDRKRGNLIVERHTLVTEKLVTENCPTLRHLSPRGSWDVGADGKKLSFDPADTDNHFVQWLTRNHHWNIGYEGLSPESQAYINVIENGDLPTGVAPKDDDTCIDLIVFGVAKLDRKKEKLTTDWKFGIGVFGAVRPENLQGRFIKLFSQDDLSGEKPFPLLGYKVPKFGDLVLALHGDQPIDGSQFIRPRRSRPLVEEVPWSSWVNDKTKSNAEDESQYKRDHDQHPEKFEPTFWQGIGNRLYEVVKTPSGRGDLALALFLAIAAAGSFEVAHGAPWWTLALIVLAVLIIGVVVAIWRRR